MLDHITGMCWNEDVQSYTEVGARTPRHPHFPVLSYYAGLGLEVLAHFFVFLQIVIEF